MTVLKLILLCAFMFAISILIGMTLLSFMNRKAQQEKITGTYMARALLLGACSLLFLFCVLVFATLLLKESFLFVYKVYLILLTVIALACVAAIIVCKKTRKFLQGQLEYVKEKLQAPETLRKSIKQWGLLLALYLVIAITYLCHKPLLESRFDLPERVSTMQQSNVLYGVNPLNGMPAAENGLVTQWTESVLPAFYLVFIRLFDIKVWDMLFKVIPFFVLALCMCAYWEIARAVFGSDNRKNNIFMLFFTIFTLCGNEAYMNPSYGLLHYAYEESTWISSVLLPCVFILIIRGVNKLSGRRKTKKE